MSEGLLAAPNEALEQHVSAILSVWDEIKSRLEPSFRRLLGDDWEQVVRVALVLHDLGKATERWQANLANFGDAKYKCHHPIHGNKKPELSSWDKVIKHLKEKHPWEGPGQNPILKRTEDLISDAVKGGVLHGDGWVLIQTLEKTILYMPRLFIRQDKESLPHAQLGAAYIWWNFVEKRGKGEELYMPAAFAVAVHHTDETLARPGVEDPASLLVERGLVDDFGRIRWHEGVSEFMEFAQEKLGAELADPRQMTVDDVARFALELRRWARGAPVLKLHRRRLQVAAVHSALKVCDVRAAAKRRETVELRGELVMTILKGGLQC